MTHSFPTRRSSDLVAEGGDFGAKVFRERLVTCAEIGRQILQRLKREFPQAISFIDPFGTGSRRSINDPCVEAGLLVQDADVQRQTMSDDAHRLLILEGFRADNGRALLGIQRDQIEPWLEITGEMLDAVESSSSHDLFYADGVI